MLQRSPTALAQVKQGNASENLLNEIRQIIYSCIKQKIYIYIYMYITIVTTT